MGAVVAAVEYSRETYGGTILSGADRWRLGVERRSTGDFGRALQPVPQPPIGP
jgi:hypothetical protein